MGLATDDGARKYAVWPRGLATVQASIMALPCLHAVSVYGKGQGDGRQVLNFVEHSKVQPLGTLLNKGQQRQQVAANVGLFAVGTKQCASNQ